MGVRAAPYEHLAFFPARLPPPGVKPNFVNPPSRARIGCICVWLSTAAMLLCIAVRVYSRLAVTRNWGSDDLLGRPFGPHTWNIRLSSLTIVVFEKVFASWSLYGISCIFVKLSLLLLYLRLFDVDRPTRTTLLSGIVVVTVFYAASVAALLGPAVPWLRRGDLLDFFHHVGPHDDRVLMAMSIFGVVSDAFLLLLPLRLVWRLHMPLRKKIGVSVLFLTGFCATGCAVASTAARANFAKTDEDWSWNAVPRYILATTEINVGIMCSSASAISAALRRRRQQQSAGTAQPHQDPKMSPWPMPSPHHPRQRRRHHRREESSGSRDGESEHHWSAIIHLPNAAHLAPPSPSYGTSANWLLPVAGQPLSSLATLASAVSQQSNSSSAIFLPDSASSQPKAAMHAAPQHLQLPPLLPWPSFSREFFAALAAVDATLAKRGSN